MEATTLVEVRAPMDVRNVGSGWKQRLQRGGRLLGEVRRLGDGGLDERGAVARLDEAEGREEEEDRLKQEERDLHGAAREEEEDHHPAKVDRGRESDAEREDLHPVVLDRLVHILHGVGDLEDISEHGAGARLLDGRGARERDLRMAKRCILLARDQPRTLRDEAAAAAAGDARLVDGAARRFRAEDQVGLGGGRARDAAVEH
mmetsp:Transcript_33411/g.91433  ORF Transcript_33411/g.91433 Transcript_33411/m.91433 type:complete len:203 (+) Transcript_33411:104-712(+)